MDFKASSMEMVTRAMRSAASIIGSKHCPMVHVCLNRVADNSCLPFNILGSQRAKCSAIRRSQLMKLNWGGAEQPLPGQTIRIIIDCDGSLSNVPVWATVDDGCNADIELTEEDFKRVQARLLDQSPPKVLMIRSKNPRSCRHKPFSLDI